MSEIYYTQADLEYINSIIFNNKDKHLLMLSKFISGNYSLKELFNYGLKFLPPKGYYHEKMKFNYKNDNYNPEIVKYFQVIADLPSISKKLSDLATDIAIYSDGSTAYTDEYYLNMDVNNLIECI